MRPYEFFSMFTIVMTVTLIFCVIFVKNGKLQTFLGIETLIITIIGFILLNMTTIPIITKNIITVLILVLYAQICISIILASNQKLEDRR